MNFGMELHRPHFLLGIFDRGNGVGRSLPSGEIQREFFGFVAVRHPDGELSGSPSNRRDSLLDIDFGVAVFAFVARANFAAERVHHVLQSVANAEHRHAEIENSLVGERERLCRKPTTGRRTE